MERINPAVKTVMLLILGLALSFGSRITVNVTVILISLLLLLASKANKKKALLTFSGALLAALSLFFTSLWYGAEAAPAAAFGRSGDFATVLAASHSLYGGLKLAVRILAYAAIGILFAFTTGGDDLVASFIHQLKLPPRYAYGILAAFHFAGNIKAEYQHVRMAFQIRGASMGFLSFQQLFVMLVNALHWSGDIAAAMESKGFDVNGERTYYQIPVVGKQDVFFVICASALILFCICGNYINGIY